MSPQNSQSSQKKKDGGDEPFLLQRMLKSRTVMLTGEVNDRSARELMNQLLLLEDDAPDETITLIVNSGGGSVNAGFAIYDLMCFIRSPIRVLCAGLTASIATIILLGAAKGQRFSLPHTKLLIHQPLIPMEVYGPASDLEITAREILETRARINEMLAEDCGQPLEKVAQDTERDYWMTAEEAVTYGLLDAIVKTRADIDAAKS
jgi:ATP-dependent Clp protease, protease subunit